MRRRSESGAADGEIKVLPVQGNVYMLVGDGRNIAASIGRDGILLVDTGTASNEHQTDVEGAGTGYRDHIVARARIVAWACIAPALPPAGRARP